MSDEGTVSTLEGYIIYLYYMKPLTHQYNMTCGDEGVSYTFFRYPSPQKIRLLCREAVIPTVCREREVETEDSNAFVSRNTIEKKYNALF